MNGAIIIMIIMDRIMSTNEFFIDILKASPIAFTVETDEYISTETAIELGLINFSSFVPKSVGLNFRVTTENISHWIDYITKSEIADIVTHYSIYKNGALIATCGDYFYTNLFDKGFYNNSSFQKYDDDFQIIYSNNLNTSRAYTQRVIEFIRVKEHNGIYFTDISMEINNETINISFSIEKQDYKTITFILKELKPNEKALFIGVYSSGNECCELGIRIKSSETIIDFMIDSTCKLISNLLWLQRQENRAEIDRLILK